MRAPANGGPVAIHRQACQAFGDSLIFLALFGLASIPATIAAWYFLRPYRAAWRPLSRAALLIAASGAPLGVLARP